MQRAGVIPRFPPYLTADSIKANRITINPQMAPGASLDLFSTKPEDAPSRPPVYRSWQAIIQGTRGDCFRWLRLALISTIVRKGSVQPDNFDLTFFANAYEKYDYQTGSNGG
jgi:hypothetical protein